MQDKTTLGISDTFRQFIEALVEEVAINGEPFDAQKKWLRKYSEAEGLDYASLEQNLEDLFQIIEEWRTSPSKSSQIAMKTLACDCFLSEEVMKKLLSIKSKSRREVGLLDGHEYVDLGLPSGTLWATCNVGADVPGGYGEYFAWGELEEKEVYSIETYIHGNGTLNSIREIGKNISGTQFDVAHVKWGGRWRMPSVKQINELIEYCAIDYGQDGFTFKSRINGNSMHLPIGGIREDDWYIDGNLYWTGEEDSKYDAYSLSLYWDADTDQCICEDFRKYLGGNIRPVAMP